MGAYVLVTAGREDAAGRIEPAQIFEKLMLLMLSEGFWPHAVAGLNDGVLEPNDVVLFCLMDPGGSQVVGDAVVAARSSPLTPQRLGQVRMYLGPTHPPDPGAFTHSVVLTETSLLDDPRRCGPESGPAGGAIAAALEGRAATGAVFRIERETFEGLSRRVVPEEAFDRPTPPSAPQPLPAAPFHDGGVREFVLSNFELVDFGEPLHPPAHRDFATPAGRIDLVCESADAQEVVAVMWANGDPPCEVLAAAHERLAWLRNDLGEDGRSVRGLVLTLDGAGELAAGGNGELEVRRVRIRCERPEPPEPEWLDPLAGAGTLAAPAIVARPSVRSAAALPHPFGEGPAAGLDFAAKCLRVPRVHR